ncbi:MAG: hypothetical protein HY301_05555 [Verrucomicrobia bacterium]|nr:hypothetical protein [Verrucomicrobiota bacterium]
MIIEATTQQKRLNTQQTQPIKCCQNVVMVGKKSVTAMVNTPSANAAGANAKASAWVSDFLVSIFT